MKRICAMLLALAMVLTVFPGAARAEEDGHIHQEEVTAPSEETAAPTEEPTQPSEEPTEAPTEEPTQAPEEERTEHSGSASISSEDVFGDEVTNEDLFAAYADRLFSPMGIMPFSVGGESAGARLAGDEAKAYNAMVPIIQQIAAGQRASAEITIGTNAPDGNFDFTTTIDTFDYTAVVTALLRDYPYEMYWFSFVEYRMGWSYYEDGTLYQFTYFLTVTPPFRGSDAYSIDTAKAASTSTAAANARAIVDQYAGQSDYNKLLGYKNEICSRVSYEHDALEDGYFEGNNNPWQLIYCFDDDPTTNIVCEGYSKAFQYLCDMSGLTCYSVTGDCGGGHMWNIVTLDGRNYMADITNSDSGTWGSDGSLFLVGGQGSVAEGYTFYDDYGYSISFYYDQKCIDTWGEEVLTLSDTDYVSHTHSYSSVVTAPTCTEGGYTTYTCSSCGSSYQSDYTTALGHNSVTDSAKAATCTEDGLTEGSHCSRCNTVLAAQQTIPALGHDVVTLPGREATCTLPGLTGGSYCARCSSSLSKQEEIPALGHDVVTDAAVAATCTETGLSEGSHCGRCNTVLAAQQTIPALGHSSVTDHAVAPTCAETGLSEGSHCGRCNTVLAAQQTIPALGHDTVIDQGYPPTDELPGLTDGSHCGRCGEILEPQKIIPIPGQATTLVLNRADLGEFGDLWVDGVPYGYNLDGEMLYVNLPDTERKILTLYSYNMTSDDPHQVYPVGMKVWRLHNDGTGYTVEALPELDNLLRYMGSSIRIVGVKGIRMITGVDEDLRARLIDGGVSGYTLEEYGTVLGWADQIVNGSLVLTDSYAKSNFAYKRGQADPIFSRANGVIAYTNVLVGFNDDQCVPDIAMRPYLILRDADGELLTVYGGMVQRSIGYIAWQNRGVFRPGTESYDYVWGIIHHVYGDQYDEEYAG